MDDGAPLAGGGAHAVNADNVDGLAEGSRGRRRALGKKMSPPQTQNRRSFIATAVLLFFSSLRDTVFIRNLLGLAMTY
ncbi:hypothetical protein, partial [Sulfitobacter sp.]|uniref:hypothetical protein n=1 Tax=Sulfitobacter sp. TaxID=1903071 RepID=UPI00260A85A8